MPVTSSSVARPTASLVFAIAAACGIADGPPLVSDRDLAAAAAQDSLWLSYGRDLGNTRFAPSARLTRSSLRLLRPRWEHRRDWQQGVIHSTPLVFGGMLFYTGYGNIVLAVDAYTGRERWRYQYVPDSSVYRSLCCGAVNRGLAAHDSTLYLATIDARLVALDARSGAVRWMREVAPLGQGYSMTLAPLVVNGRVIVGVSGGEFGVRGFVDAYDARTGERRWRFWTVPSPEQGGWWGSWATTTIGGSPLPRDIAREKADSARYADAWRHGGGGVWTTPAYDRATGLLFFGTGNPSPPYDGSIRPGDNLYTSAIVAVHASDGTLAWYRQIVPHDLWDFDAASPPVLLDVRTPAGVVPAVAHAGKTGRVYVLDRRSGRLLARSAPLVPVGAIYDAPSADTTEMAPGIWGGVHWSPAAYSPRTGLLYVRAMHNPVRIVRQPAGPHRAGARWDGGEVISEPSDSAWSVMSAVDPSSGRIVWSRRTPGPQFGGGVLVTGADLVFFADQLGALHALDARTGDELWTTQTNKYVSAAPIIYSLGGRDYLALPTMGGLIVYSP